LHDVMKEDIMHFWVFW